MQQVNTAKSTSYLVTLTDRPYLTIRSQNASIGSVLLGEAPYPIGPTQLVVPGNTLEFSPITIKILCSEDMSEWIQIYKWMIECTRSVNLVNLDIFDRLQVSVLNLQNIPIVNVFYKDVWPTTLGDVIYDINSEEETLAFDLSLRYSSIEIEIISTGERIIYAGQEN